MNTEELWIKIRKYLWALIVMVLSALLAALTAFFNLNPWNPIEPTVTLTVAPPSPTITPSFVPTVTPEPTISPIETPPAPTVSPTPPISPIETPPSPTLEPTISPIKTPTPPISPLNTPPSPTPTCEPLECVPGLG